MARKPMVVAAILLAAGALSADVASAQVSCSGVPAFASCTAYATGASVTYSGSKYTTIAPIPATRDCPPNSPFNPSNDNWWTNNGTCTTTATATATRTATATATRTATATTGATATRTNTATATSGRCHRHAHQHGDGNPHAHCDGHDRRHGDPDEHRHRDGHDGRRQQQPVSIGVHLDAGERPLHEQRPRRQRRGVGADGRLQRSGGLERVDAVQRRRAGLPHVRRRQPDRHGDAHGHDGRRNGHGDRHGHAHRDADHGHADAHRLHELPTANRWLIGYWHNFDNGSGFIKLRDVLADWDIIKLSFGEPTSGPAATSASCPIAATSQAEIISDIAILHGRGKKVLLSIGGAERPGAAHDDGGAGHVRQLGRRASSTRYGLDGLDIDFEGHSLSSTPATPTSEPDHPGASST